MLTGWTARPGACSLPALPMARIAEPLRIHLDFDAASVDEMIARLAVLRAQMLPAPQRN